jgi:hypothetical protein
MRLAIWLNRLTASNASVAVLELVPALRARGLQVAVLGRPGSLAGLFEEAGAEVLLAGFGSWADRLIALHRLREFRPDVVWTLGEKVLAVASHVMAHLDALFVHHLLLTDEPEVKWEGRRPDCFLAWWLVLCERARERGLKCQDVRVGVRVRRGELDGDKYTVLVYDCEPENYLYLVSVACRAAAHLAAAFQQPVELVCVRPVSDASEEWPEEGVGQLGEGLVRMRRVGLRAALRELGRYHAAFAWSYGALQAFGAGVPVYCGHPGGVGVGPLTRRGLFMGMTLWPLQDRSGVGVGEEEWLAEVVRCTEQDREAQRLDAEELLSLDACAEKLVMVFSGLT